MTAATKERRQLTQEDAAERPCAPPMERLAQRRAMLHDLIERERLARAAAALDERQFDPASLHAAEGELAGPDDAEGELARRERAKAAHEASERRKVLRQRFAEVSMSWISDIEDAEALFRSAVDAMRRADAARSELQGITHQLLGSVPLPLHAKGQEDRHSRALAALLQAYCGQSRFGEVELHPGIAAAGDAWAEVPRKVVAELETQLKGRNDE